MSHVDVDPQCNTAGRAGNGRSADGSFRAHSLGKNATANLSGNSRKSMHVSVKESLRKLRTDYVRAKASICVFFTTTTDGR